MLRKLSIFVVCFLFLLCAAYAQENRSEVAVSALGSFPKETIGNSIQQDPTNSAGFLLSYSYTFRPHSALALNYSYTRDTQYYTVIGSITGPIASQQANVHEITGAYVLDVGRGRRLDPFLLAGGGALIFSPISNSTNSTFGSTTQTAGTFVYGFGLNYRLVHALGVRLQYRGLIYKAPDFGVSEISTGSWSHSAEPSIGLTYSF
jgi:opacity protein-like surface antigen